MLFGCLAVLCLGLIGVLAYLALQRIAPERDVAITPSAPAAQAALSPTPAPLSTSLPTSTIPFPELTPTSLLSPTTTVLPNPTCILTATGGLASEIYAIVQGMPGPDSNGMRVPSDAQLAAWESLTRAVMQGDLPAACQIIYSQGFPYHLIDFTDVRNANERYWMLREDAPVSVGWGTYVFRLADGSPGSNGQLPLIVEVPHPVADWRTDPEGVEIFRKSKARALLVAGTHRCADTGYSACTGETMSCGEQEPYRISDVAHTTQSIFQATHRALALCDGSTVVLQLHANSLANCGDLFISNGTLFPGARSQALFEAASSICKKLKVDIADGTGLNGMEECSFTSGAAVQAVYSNSCAAHPDVNACTAQPLHVAGSEQFISLEQSGKLTNDYQCLLKSIQAVWGSVP